MFLAQETQGHDQTVVGPIRRDFTNAATVQVGQDRDVAVTLSGSLIINSQVRIDVGFPMIEGIGSFLGIKAHSPPGALMPRRWSSEPSL